MTIDEAENYLIALKHCETCEANDTNICKACPDYRRGSSAKCYDAIDVGVDIIRKYQKIKHIISKWDAGIYDDEGLCDAEVLEMISDEVYENGNAD